MSEAVQAPATVETDVPARIDRLPWAAGTGWSCRAGTVWILDGLEVTLVGAIARGCPRTARDSPQPRQIGLAARPTSPARVGALVFGYLTDRLGRKKLFLVTLGGLPGRPFLTAFSLGPLELRRLPVPHRRGHRRRVLGDQLGHRRADPRAGAGHGSIWRSTAASGSALPSARRSRGAARPRSCRPTWAGGWPSASAPSSASAIIFRRNVPGEPALAVDPRPQRGGRADRGEHREEVEDRPASRSEPERARSRPASASRSASARWPATCSEVPAADGARPVAVRLAGVPLQRRALHFRTILSHFYRCRRAAAPALLPRRSRVGNFLGPLLLGRLFDTVGRKPMIAGTT